MCVSSSVVGVLVKEIDMNKPEPNKQYALTGGKGVPCIANGNSWEESEVKPMSRNDAIRSGVDEALRKNSGLWSTTNKVLEESGFAPLEISEQVIIGEIVDEVAASLADKEREVGRVCPRCREEYYEWPALSRRDNKTEICPACGIAEAMEDSGHGVAYTGEPYWEVKDAS